MYHVSLYLFFTSSKNTGCICTAFTYCYVSVQVSEWQRMLLFCSSSIYRMSQLFCIPWSCCDLQQLWKSVSRRQVRRDTMGWGAVKYQLLDECFTSLISSFSIVSNGGLAASCLYLPRARTSTTRYCNNAYVRQDKVRWFSHLISTGTQPKTSISTV